MTAIPVATWMRAVIIVLAVGASLLRDPRLAGAQVSGAAAQNAVRVEQLTGAVYDSLVGAPLSGAFIQVASLDRGTVALSAVSDRPLQHWSARTDAGAVSQQQKGGEVRGHSRLAQTVICWQPSR
jgi:hypothetical protein